MLFIVQLYSQDANIDSPMYVVELPPPVPTSSIQILTKANPHLRFFLRTWFNLSYDIELNWIRDTSVSDSKHTLYYPICPRDVVDGRVLNVRVLVTQAAAEEVIR